MDDKALKDVLLAAEHSLSLAADMVAHKEGCAYTDPPFLRCDCGAWELRQSVNEFREAVLRLVRAKEAA